jgi:tetratricopeptide (TPR) repeat protein
MNCTCKLLAVAFAAVALLSLDVHAQSTAVAELSLGVEAYKQSKYAEAIQHFQRAVSLDPENQNAHMYLATAYAQQYLPGVEADNNNRLGEQAIEQYKAVLELDPKNINSVKGLASMYLQIKQSEDAKIYYRKAVEIDSNDAEAYYSIGVIDWVACYQPRMEKRAKMGLKPDQSLNSSNPHQKKACDDLKAKNTPLIEEGIDSLNRAIELRPDYGDAMAYMNLMYREKADVECDDLVARAADRKTADQWVDKTMATKKAKAQESSEPSAPNPQ